MRRIKTKIIRVFLLFILQALACPKSCLSETLEFLDNTDSRSVAVLQRDIKIPIGSFNERMHHIILPTGMPIHEISSEIAQKREVLGLSREIDPTQQDQFFQECHWQLARNEVQRMPMPGRIISISVRPGDQVSRGSSLCIIEAMKMQHTVRSSIDGTIQHIAHNVQDLVEAGSVLISILPNFANWETIDQQSIVQHKDVLLSFFPWATPALVEVPSHSPLDNPRENFTNEPQNANPVFETLSEGVPPLFVSILPDFTNWETINQQVIAQDKNLFGSFFPCAMPSLVEASFNPPPSNPRESILPESACNALLLENDPIANLHLQKPGLLHFARNDAVLFARKNVVLTKQSRKTRVSLLRSIKDIRANILSLVSNSKKFDQERPLLSSHLVKSVTTSYSYEEQPLDLSFFSHLHWIWGSMILALFMGVKFYGRQSVPSCKFFYQPVHLNRKSFVSQQSPSNENAQFNVKAA